MHTAIETPAAGVLSGRDAVYMSEFTHSFEEGDDCILKGELNSTLASLLVKGAFVPFVLSFREVLYFQCCALDNYENEKQMVSSFDLVTDSLLIDQLTHSTRSSRVDVRHNHYVLATYDHVYEFVASGYKLTLGG